MMQMIADTIAGERGVAGVQQLLAPTQIRPVVERMMQQPARLAACYLRRAKFKPGRKITAYYDLEIGASSEPRHERTMRSIAVTWQLPGAHQSLPTAAGALGAEIAARGLAAPFQQLIYSEPDATMHVQVAPLDPLYPQLARLADATYLREVLRDYAPDESRWQVTPIRYRPRQRHVLRYDAGLQQHGGIAAAPPDTPTTGVQKTLFAKLYADAGRQGDAALLQQLAEWLAAMPTATRVLQPLAYLPGEYTVLYAQAPGEPLSANLGAPSAAADRAITKQLWQAGAALRRLHNAPEALSSSLSTHPIAQEVKAIRRTCEQIAVLLPALGRQIDSLLTRATAEYAALPQEAPTFVHGDFKADHLLAAKGQLTLLDFDTCALADPALDIGKFLADLAWHMDDAHAAHAAMANAFLAGYDLAPTAPRLRRARVWQALIGIKIAAHRVQIFDRQWATRTTTAIRRVAACFGDRWT